MRYDLILLLVSLGISDSQIADDNKTDKRKRVIPYFRGFPLRRNSHGQYVPILRSSETILTRPNERLFLVRQRGGIGRDSRAQRLLSASLGTSSLRGIGARSPRIFRMPRFFSEARRNKTLTMPFRSNTRMSTPRLSITPSKWPRRINVPQKSLPRETGKRIPTHPGLFPPYPGKFNLSIIRPSFGDEASPKSKPLRGSVSGIHGFRSPLKRTNRRISNTQALSSPAAHPKSTNVGIASRILNKQPIRRRFGSRFQPRPRVLASGRKRPIHRTMPYFSRPILKGSRSPLRLPSGRIPLSYLISNFRSFDRRISPRNRADIASSYNAFKSALLVNKKARFRQLDRNLPRNKTTKTTFLMMGSYPVVTSENSKNSSKVVGENNSEHTIAGQFTTGTEDGNATGSVSAVTESSTVSKTSDKAMDANQTSLLPIGLSNSNALPSGNTTQDLASTIDSERPNAEAPAQNNRNPNWLSKLLSTRKPNIKKVSGLNDIVNTRENFKSTMEDGGQILKAKQSDLLTNADLLSELDKRFRFSNKAIAEMDSDENWKKLLRESDRIRDEKNFLQENKLKWPMEILINKEEQEVANNKKQEVANNKEQEVANNGGKPIITSQKTEPNSIDKMMTALGNGFNYYDVFIADRESNGASNHIFRASKINFTKQDEIPKTQNAEIDKVKTQNTAINKAKTQNAASEKVKDELTADLNPAYDEVPAEHVGQKIVSIDSQVI